MTLLACAYAVLTIPIADNIAKQSTRFSSIPKEKRSIYACNLKEE
jgi:hypothetical protein